MEYYSELTIKNNDKKLTKTNENEIKLEVKKIKEKQTMYMNFI